MKIIGKILQKKGSYSNYEGAYICFVAQEIIHGKYDKKIKTISYKNHKLKLKTENNYIATEIRLQEKKIISEINSQLKIEKIKKLIIH